MLHSMHPIYGMLCPSAPFTFRSKSVIEQIVGLGVNESYRYSDMVVICEPLSIKAYVSVPLMVMVVSLECPTSLSKRLYRGFNATLSYLAFMKFFRRAKKHVSILAITLFFTIF